MRRRRLHAAAPLVVAALLAPWPAAAARLDDAEKEASTVEERLLLVERTHTRPDESAGARGRRKFSEGETQFLLGDWLHAAVLLYEAIDQPELQASPDYPVALGYLGDALRQQGSCAAALIQYQQLLRLGEGPTRAKALVGALDCRIRLRRFDGLDELLAEAQGAFPGGPPPEVAYLAAKALYLRTDLRPAQRLARAGEAFAAVAPPYHLAAAYFLGVLQLEAGELGKAAEAFQRCTTLEGKEERQAEIRELCGLAQARLYAAQERWAESLDRYQVVPRDSPHFNEALYEIAWNFVRSQRNEEALRTASMIVDLEPESPLAADAAILTGHLDLRLGHFAEASEAFDRIVATFGPVRDQIDAILASHPDPVAYLNELVTRQGKAFDLASVLPPAAVKWASSKEVVGALDLVSDVERGRRELDESAQIAARLQALLARSGGLDAAPLLEGGWASADALQTALARLQGSVADDAVQTAQGALAPEARAELERVHAERLALQARLDQLPRSPDEVQARQDRMSKRLDVVERAAFQLRLQVDSGAAAIAGTEVWLAQHRVVGDEAGRAQFAEELRQQRAVVAQYQEELRGLGKELETARDAARGVEVTEGEAELRRGYQALVSRERTLVAAARGALTAAQVAELDRGEALLDRLARLERKALELKEQLAAMARRRAEGLLAQVTSEQAALAQEQAGVDGVLHDSQNVIGLIAFQSFKAVRAQFYKLVLKADVGLIDVAWSRKRERLERIQELSQAKATDLEALDRDYKAVLREVE